MKRTLRATIISIVAILMTGTIVVESSHGAIPVVVAGKAVAKGAAKKLLGKKAAGKKRSVMKAIGKTIRTTIRRPRKPKPGSIPKPPISRTPVNPQPPKVAARNCPKVIGVKKCFRRNRVLDQIRTLQSSTPNALPMQNQKGDGSRDMEILDKVLNSLNVDSLIQKRDKAKVSPEEVIDRLEAADADPKGKWEQVPPAEAVKSAEAGQVAVLAAPGNEQNPQGMISIILPGGSASRLVVVQLGPNGKIGTNSAEAVFGGLRSDAVPYVFVGNDKEPTKMP
jgi:hypothetical protein